MIRAKFLTTKQRKELEHIVRQPSQGHGVGRRANAILLLDDGLSCQQIGKVLYLDDDTVRTWYKHYGNGGWDELEMFDWKGGQPFLTMEQQALLCAWLETRLCRDSNQIRVYIDQRFGVGYPHSGCVKLLHRLGFEYKKPKALPRVANEVEQRQFILLSQGAFQAIEEPALKSLTQLMYRIQIVTRMFYVFPLSIEGIPGCRNDAVDMWV